MVPPVLLFFLKIEMAIQRLCGSIRILGFCISLKDAIGILKEIVLAIRGLLCFHTNYENFCSSSVKNASGSLIGIALNL